ncbi:zf-HC2 domain-containing protein [Halomonas sp. ZH2S]|uniref:Zf-HC2 domain-containing protein n=1 Tax=Vreelandella zhuhanensis TaxID=2684210 RepID=A0A7X3H368_9GAMM|nr:zf-HC2 domain-containing protein [Halomonas zhuhanensis]MWJ28808.1 zf-HC2 domain-containing protein [Halomonas zhuhanensis]
MIMCQRATELMSQRLDRPLSWLERVSLRLHLSMCGACSQCNRQFDLLHQVGERHPAVNTHKKPSMK